MLIGLSGKQGTGKSTIAKAIQDTYKDVKIFKIAGIIYELQDYIYNRVGLTLQGDKDRPLLIALGMWGRDKDSDLWTNVAIREALEYSKQGGIALIDDIRFPNEALRVKENGLLIRIEGLQRGPNITEEMKTNITECALDDFKFEHIISNENRIEIMTEQLNSIITRR